MIYIEDKELWEYHKEKETFNYCSTIIAAHLENIQYELLKPFKELLSWVKTMIQNLSKE